MREGVKLCIKLKSHFIEKKEQQQPIFELRHG